MAVHKLKKNLYTFKDKIMENCLSIDKNNSGCVTINDLVAILEKCVANIPYKEIKDRLCECDDTSNTAYYNTLFTNVQTNSKYITMPDSITGNFKLLISIFHMIDASGDGFISPDEFKKACTKVFNYLDVSYTEKEILEFIDVIDQNNDNKIDLEEFANAFTVSITS